MSQGFVLYHLTLPAYERRSHGLYERWTRGAFDGSDDGGKFQQHAVAGRLDDAAAEVGHHRPGGIAPPRTAFAVPASSSPMSRE